MYLPDDQSEILPVDGQLDVDGDDAPDDVHDDGIDDDRINIDARLPDSRRRNQFGVHNWRAKWQWGMTTEAKDIQNYFLSFTDKIFLPHFLLYVR